MFSNVFLCFSFFFFHVFHFSFFFDFFFSKFSFFSFVFFSFFIFPVLLFLDAGNEKNRREVPVVKATIFLCENSIYWASVDTGFGMAHLRVTLLSCFSIPVFQFLIFPFLKNVSSFFFDIVSFKNFHCWHLYQSLIPVDVSSVVGAPWGCGVLTTQSGIAGIGLGHLLGGEHGSTPQSWAEAPRLLKRSLLRLYCCCCWFGHMLTRCDPTSRQNITVELCNASPR